MSSHKRAREDEDIQIKVAAGESVAAESFVLRALSSCARALPADAADWDVSGLLIDGQPYSRAVVSCWVQCCNSHNYVEDLDTDSINQLSTVIGLTQVLAFADAVGSYAGVFKAACSQLERLQIVVQLPEQMLELPMIGFSYAFDDKQVSQMQLRKPTQVGAPLSSQEQCLDMKRQVAKQLSALLQLAHVLRLQPLLSVLHQFLLANAGVPGGAMVLGGVTGLVFSDAVLEAALGSSTFSKEAYVNSVLSQPCSLLPCQSGSSSLLKPVGVPTYDAESKALKFDAQLLADFMGGKAGAAVKVELDLFIARITLRLPSSTSCLRLPMHLVVGRKFSDAAALDAFLKVDSAL